MDVIPKALYDNFCTPPDIAELKQEAQDNHRLLTERLEKPERKLVQGQAVCAGNVRSRKGGRPC